jgi:hypothetical protein
MGDLLVDVVHVCLLDGQRTGFAIASKRLIELYKVESESESVSAHDMTVSCTFLEKEMLLESLSTS